MTILNDIAIARQSYVDVAVFNILGRRVGTLASGTVPPGRHEVLMDGLGLSSGVYIVRMEADAYAAARRIVLNR
jgi:hypothetical protein